MDLHLVLTGECNLACAYCYQDARRRPGAISADVAEAALAAALAEGAAPHRVILSGGEPFLARARVVKVLRLLRAGAPRWGHVGCVVLSNGTVVSDADLDLLAAHDAELQLSFDGPEVRQALRRPGTFRVLDRLVSRAFARQPSWASRRLTIQMMLPGAAVSDLAEVVRDHVERGVPAVSVEPLATHDPGWSRLSRRRLEVEVREIVSHSLAHHDRTGRVPVTFLRGNGEGPSPVRAPSPFVCGAASGTNVTVDPDGRAWACPAVVPSLQQLPPMAREAASALCLGDVRSPDFPRRLAELPRRAGPAPLLQSSRERRSSGGRCRDCDLVSDCRVCPLSTAFVPGNPDPHWVPENQCDFQQVTLPARRRFQGRIGGAALIRDMRRRRLAGWERRLGTPGEAVVSRGDRAEA